MAIIHARRMRLPRPHEAIAPASPGAHIIVGGRRQMLSDGKRVSPSAQSNAPSGYGAAPRGVGYPCALSSSATFTLPRALAIGTGDFTVFLHYHVHKALVPGTYNYLLGASATYFTFSPAHQAMGDKAGWVSSGNTNSGLTASAPGEYRVVVRRSGGQLRFIINGITSADFANTVNSGSLTYLCANSYQTAQGLGAADTTLYFAGVEARAWSDAEISAYMTRPERVFAPIEDDRWFDPQIATSGGTISINQFAQYRVFEGASGSASVTISGSHTGATDTIQYRIEDLAGNGITTWATLQADVVEGAFSAAVTVPRGGWYYARVRKLANQATQAVQTQQWGVGYIVGGFGQSHLVLSGTSGTATPDARAVIHDGTSWSLMTSTGSGRNAFCSALVAAANCPVAYIISATSGVPISTYWSGGKTSGYTSWEAKVTAAGGKLSAFMLWQGEGDVALSRTKAAYKADIDAIFAQLRTDYGAGLPVVIGMLGQTPDGATTDDMMEQIRDAHVDAANDAGNYGFVYYDCERGGDAHLTAAGYAAANTRAAQAVAHSRGDATYSRGPSVAYAVRTAPTIIDIGITHAGGTDFTPTTGITGFAVLDSGAAVTISSAVRLAADKIRLTLASTPTGTVTVRYGYGKLWSLTGTPRDNTGMTLPLITTDADVTVLGRKVLLSCIQRVGGGPAANVTGLRWAFFDQSAPNALAAPVVTGTGESTDASGVLEIDVIGTSLNVGDTGYLVTDTSAGVGFAGPVVVSG